MIYFGHSRSGLFYLLYPKIAGDFLAKPLYLYKKVVPILDDFFMVFPS